MKASMLSDKDEVQLLQLTDCHLFSATDAKLLGLETEASLKAVIADVQTHRNFDVVLATGDISQDASAVAYDRFCVHLNRLDKPSFWIPGNHDDPVQMQASLDNGQVYPHKRIITPHWQIILLDSSIRKKVHGFLSNEAMQFLRLALNDKPKLNTMVVLHHQPRDVGSLWLDAIGLHNRDELMTELTQHPQLKAVLWGHVHQQYDKKDSGVVFMSTPSTCVQFEPGSIDFEAGRQAPGYRMIKLQANGQIETKIYRIESRPFEVDYTIKGY